MRGSQSEAPWGSCPRCGRALVRDELPLQSWPARLYLQGPPLCPVCTPEEMERYFAQWDSAEQWGQAEDGEF